MLSLGCGKRNPAGSMPDEPDTPQNLAPEAVDRIPDQELTLGEAAVELDVAKFFRDTDGDSLRYDAVSSNDSIVTATASGSVVTIRPESPGSANVRVTATDSHGLSASQTIRVHVEEAQPPDLPDPSEPPEPPEPPYPPDAPDPPLTGPYTPLEWLRVSAGGIEIHDISAGFIDCIPLDATVNGVRYKVHQSHWQRRVDSTSSWTDLPDTRRNGVLICSYTPTRSGEYRLVMEMSIDGNRGRYSSSNTIVASCIPNSDECFFT